MDYNTLETILEWCNEAHDTEDPIKLCNIITKIEIIATLSKNNTPTDTTTTFGSGDGEKYKEKRGYDGMFSLSVMTPPPQKYKKFIVKDSSSK
jgi:hypothetical protein